MFCLDIILNPQMGYFYQQIIDVEYGLIANPIGIEVELLGVFNTPCAI